MMSTEMYNDVLKVIYDAGKNMEKKPLFILEKTKKVLETISLCTGNKI
jgi:hypothetical protein